MPVAAAGAGGSICLVCSLAVAACVAPPVFMAHREGTAPSPAASGVTADPGNKEKLGQKGIFTEVSVADGGVPLPACALKLARLEEDLCSDLRHYKDATSKECEAGARRGCWRVPLCWPAPP